jgi:uncharacterized protein (DUF2336 family)
MPEVIVNGMFPKLEGLDSLARRDGIDIRPTLVRVLTDLYVQKPAHTAEEERHYTELALRLIDTVDLATRTAVAKKIAGYAGAPPAVARRLARDVIEVAEPILSHCDALTSTDLESIVRDFGWSHAAIIAVRRDAAAPAAAESKPALMASSAALPTTRARPVPTRPPVSEELSLAELFFSADSPARRMLLASLGSVEAETPQSVQPVETNRALEAAALGRDHAGFVRLIEGALSLSRAQAERIVLDPSGEPLLVAAKALAMPAVTLQRVMMFIDPAIGESVDRYFDLVGLYEKVSADAAHKLIASVRGQEPVRPRRPATHRPMYYDDEATRSRRGAATRRTGIAAEPQAPSRSEPRRDTSAG